MLKAAELEGSDGKGTEGLIGYCRHVAQEDLKAFTSLLGRVLPLQIAGDTDHPVITEIRTVTVDPKTGPDG